MRYTGFLGSNSGRNTMRKWCATVAMGVLFALPLCAQQKDASTASKSNTSSENTATTNATAGDFSIAPASSSLFPMPAAAAARPADIFSDWDNNPWNRHAWGLLTPKYEIAGMFQYVNFCPCSFRIGTVSGPQDRSPTMPISIWASTPSMAPTISLVASSCLTEPTTRPPVSAAASRPGCSVPG